MIGTHQAVGIWLEAKGLQGSSLASLLVSSEDLFVCVEGDVS